MIAYFLVLAVLLAAAWLARGYIIYQIEILINTISGTFLQGHCGELVLRK